MSNLTCKLKVLDFFSLKWIRNRLGLAQIIIVMFTAMSIGILTYQQSCQLLVQNSISAHKDILNSSEKILRKKEEQCRECMRTILKEDKLSQVLQRENMTGHASQSFEERSQAELNELLEPYLYGVYQLNAIYIYDLQGNYYSLGDKKYTDAALAANREGVQEQPWYRKAVSENGYEVFYGRDVVSGAEDTFSGIKLLRDINTQKPVGLMVTAFSKGLLRDVFPDYEEKGTYHLMEDLDGVWEEVYAIGELAEVDLPAALNESGHTAAPDDEKYYIVVGNDECMWLPVYCENKNAVFVEAAGIRKIILTVTMLCLIGAVFLMTWISFRLLTPLSRLKDLIISVGKGQRNIDEQFGEDEIGLIGQEFQRTVNDKIALSEAYLQEQIATQRAELALMQSNINPHFLYNTLDSLYWMAIEKEEDEIAEVVQALSDIFRIALSKGDSEITVEKEISFIRSYLYIQNIRFDHKIKLDISVDPEIRQKKIIKMLLQPFVENAVYHGLEPKIGMGTITLSLKEEGGGIAIRISDDGVGVKDLSDLEKGYAIRNVSERIRLKYGDKGKISFQSGAGEGTTVQIFLPANE